MTPDQKQAVARALAQSIVNQNRARPRPEVIVVHESIAASWIKDLLSLLTMILMVSAGRAIGSYALEWVGAFLGLLFLFNMAHRTFIRGRMTIEDARRRLDEIERGL